MSHLTKVFIVVAAISLGAFVSQIISGEVETADQADSPDGASTVRGQTDAGTAAQSEQQPRRRSRQRADDLPLRHAILKDEDVSPDEKIISSLDKPTNVAFLDLPLEDAIAFLSEYHGVNIWLDKSTLTDEGVSLDQPVTLKLAGVRFESILNLLLRPLQLDWVVEDEVLKITTSAWAYDHPEIRTYDVENLVEAGHAAEELIAAITQCVEPGTWTGKDAIAGISHTGGVVVVRHTQRAHGEIAQLIADLDDIAADDQQRRGGQKDKDAVVSIKVYRIGNQPAEKVAEALQDFVVSSSWKDHGGAGEVRALNGALLVRQTAAMHRSVQRFLAQIEPKAPANRDASDVPPTPASSASDQSSQDPFGVLKRAGHSGAGAGQPAGANRHPKSGMKTVTRAKVR